MEILVKRIAKKETYTIGKMYIDGKYFCDTLEDKDRGLSQSMTEEEIRKIKVYGLTAIPTGAYKVIVNYSERFGKLMPLLLDVKGYAGVRIHSGNTPSDTLGCILVGRNTAKGMVTESRKTFLRLMETLKRKNEVVLRIS